MFEKDYSSSDRVFLRMNQKPARRYAAEGFAAGAWEAQFEISLAPHFSAVIYGTEVTVTVSTVYQ
jgi:hypothetical protein